jgi:hypothetical protein
VLCTDGVLEQITDEILCEILKSDQPNEAKKQAILAHCQDQTRDNYSGILIQIASNNATQLAPIEATTPNTATPVPANNDDVDSALPHKLNSRYSWLGGLLVAAGLGALLYCFWQPKPIPPTKHKPAVQQQQKPIASPRDKSGGKQKNKPTTSVQF